MATLSLDDIRDSIEKEFVSTTITIGEESVKMVNPLRMAKDQRAKLSKTLKAASTGGDDESLEDAFEKMIAVIRDAIPDAKQAKVLLDEIGDDMAVAVKVLDAYMEAMKPGEASGSQS